MSELSKRLIELDEESLSRIYMEVFNTDNGKLVLEDLKNRAFANDPTSPDFCIVDPYRVLENEGKRKLLLHILTQLKPFEAAEKEQNDNA